jgi:hypothetical protein
LYVTIYFGLITGSKMTKHPKHTLLKSILVFCVAIGTFTFASPQDESDLLLSGEADALFHAAEPKAYILGNPKIIRLFPNYRKVEQIYYKKTGIFPIMHAVAIKTSLLKKHPWLAKTVFDAYSESKKLTYNYMQKMG